MGYSITKQNDNASYNVTELIVDAEAELSSIDISSFGPGSTAICLDTKSVYMLNTQKEWTKF